MNGWMPQSGIGIDCESEVFRAVYVKQHRNRARVADTLEVPEYRALGPSECGRRYREFLRKHGLKAPQTVVALPRRAVLLRSLGFPRTVENELASAVEYQLDNLHPFEQGEVCWDYAVWKQPQASAWKKLAAKPEEPDGGRLHVLVGIAARAEVDETAAWFEEAGIPVSQFGVKAALWIAMFWERLQEAFPGAPALFLLQAGAGPMELIGYAPGREPVWQEFATAEDTETQAAVAEEMAQELEQARAALRVGPEDRLPLVVCGSAEASASLPGSAELPFQIVPGEQLLGSIWEGAKALGRGTIWPGLAAGLAAAGNGGPLRLNLLPVERRTYESARTHVPTYALAGLVAALALALGARGTFQDWLYSQHLERELQALRPQLQALEITQTGAEEAQERLQVLKGVRQSARAPLEVLDELTRILPAEAWLQQFSYDGQTVNITGIAPEASGLLQTLAASPYFENPQFESSLSRTDAGEERFTISARLRGGNGEGVAP